jgi:hypothetical protein
MPSRSWNIPLVMVVALTLGACATGSYSVSTMPGETPAAPATAAPSAPAPDTRVVRIVRPGFEPKFCRLPADTPFLAPTACTRLAAGTTVLTNQRISRLTYSFFQVTLQNGVSGYIEEDEYFDMDTEALRARRAAEIPYCARTGRVGVGMTRSQVTFCWGQPRRVIRTDSKSGIRERLIYGRDTVYLVNDVVERVRTLE